MPVEAKTLNLPRGVPCPDFAVENMLTATCEIDPEALALFKWREAEELKQEKLKAKRLARRLQRAAQLRELGQQYINGDGFEKNDAKAYALFQQAAAHGDKIATLKIGLLKFLGHGTERDEDEGMKWIIRAAEQELDTAQMAAGLIHINGTSVPKDKQKGMRWIRRAASNGNKDALFYLMSKDAEKYKRLFED